MRLVGVAVSLSREVQHINIFVCVAASFIQYIAFWLSIVVASGMVVPVGIKSSIEIPFPICVPQFVVVAFVAQYTTRNS